jgi:formate C-acetyltransferase
MMSLGVTCEEARTCDIKGCYEFSVKAGEVSTAPLYLNLLKPISLVLHNGKDPLTGIQIGPETGSIEQLSNFDKFYEAYMRQLDAILEDGMRITDQFEQYLDVINPALMFSATIEGSLMLMKDAYATGSKYNNTVVLHTGFASAIDALMAVKQLVFDTGAVTLAELQDALIHDWNGYELLRAKALNCPHKFGNHDSLADLYASALSRWLCMKENLRPNARGGVYKAAMHSARKYIDFGLTTEATPDGRKLGEEMSKNISPVMGMDTQGVTALIHSATQLDPSMYTEDFNVDVMLHPSAVSGEEGLSAMKAILNTYMQRNGLAIQFNVFDSQTLRDAQAHPEQYKNLQVRVCGWNVLFNNMSKAEQDAFILRSERIAI